MLETHILHSMPLVILTDRIGEWTTLIYASFLANLIDWSIYSGSEIGVGGT